MKRINRVVIDNNANTATGCPPGFSVRTVKLHPKDRNGDGHVCVKLAP